MRPCAPRIRAQGGSSPPYFLLSLLDYFLSSTSTNSASTTLSLPLSSGLPWPSVGGCCAPVPGGGVLLYMASASLWLAVVRRSTAALILSASFSLRTFLVSSRAASISLASASPTLERCSLSVFSTL